MATDSATYSVLIVDNDDQFVEATRTLLEGHKVHTARNISDAQRRLVEESIDLAIAGPSYAHEAGVVEVTLLFDVRADLPVVLVADAVDTNVLRAALRAGIKDVIEVPLTSSKIEDAFGLIEQIHRREEEGPAKRRIGKVVTIMSNLCSRRRSIY